MKKFIRGLVLISGAVLCFLHAPVHAQPQRVYLHAEIEALLAPIALYPQPLLAHVLVASTYPTEVMEAARHGSGYADFHPSVRVLLDYPEVLQQMARSPAWMFDLGNAYLAQGPQVMGAVEALRLRAQPPAPQVVYVSQPVYIPQPVYVQPPVYIAQPVYIPRAAHHHHHPHEADRRPNGTPSPAAQMQRGNDPSPAARMQGHRRPPHVSPVVRVPEANRQPIVRQPDVKPRYTERRTRG